MDRDTNGTKQKEGQVCFLTFCSIWATSVRVNRTKIIGLLAYTLNSDREILATVPENEMKGV